MHLTIFNLFSFIKKTFPKAKLMLTFEKNKLCICLPICFIFYVCVGKIVYAEVAHVEYSHEIRWIDYSHVFLKHNMFCWKGKEFREQCSVNWMKEKNPEYLMCFMERCSAQRRWFDIPSRGINFSLAGKWTKQNV